LSLSGQHIYVQEGTTSRILILLGGNCATASRKTLFAFLFSQEYFSFTQPN